MATKGDEKVVEEDYGCSKRTEDDEGKHEEDSCTREREMGASVRFDHPRAKMGLRLAIVRNSPKTGRRMSPGMFCMAPAENVLSLLAQDDGETEGAGDKGEFEFESVPFCRFRGKMPSGI